jgi:peptide chain release factor 1
MSAAAHATGFEADVISDRESVVTLRITGEGAAALFSDEPGGHRWQRVPPTEKRGRVHTSTVTVAVLAEAPAGASSIPDRDIRWTATRGSGAGGQARNKTSNAVQVWHKPTGLTVRCESERSQSQNLASAKAVLAARILAASRRAATAAEAESRRQQVGTGQRGDKRRTIRVLDDQVTDHVTGRRWRFRAYLRGEW